MNKGEKLNPVSILYGLLKTNSEPFYNQARIVIKAKTSKRKLPNQLVTTKTSEVSISGQIHAIMTHPRFCDYELTNRDVSVIALLWKRYIDCIGAVSSWNVICCEAGMDIYTTNECLEYISDLLDRNIIAFNEIIPPEKIQMNYHHVLLRSAPAILSWALDGLGMLIVDQGF